MDIATAKRLIDELTTDLSRRGFAIDARGRLVTVTNPCAEDTSPLYGRILNRGLRQTVILQPHRDRADALWWFWEWPGPSQDAAPEYEPLCPAEQVAEAADRISKVLATQPATTRTEG